MSWDRSQGMRPCCQRRPLENPSIFRLFLVSLNLNGKGSDMNSPKNIQKAIQPHLQARVTGCAPNCFSMHLSCVHNLKRVALNASKRKIVENLRGCHHFSLHCTHMSWDPQGTMNANRNTNCYYICKKTNISIRM